MVQKNRGVVGCGVVLGNLESKIQWQFRLYNNNNKAKINSVTTIAPLYFFKQ